MWALPRLGISGVGAVKRLHLEADADTGCALWDRRLGLERVWLPALPGVDSFRHGPKTRNELTIWRWRAPDLCIQQEMVIPF